MNHNMKRTAKGFTLIELIIVIAIIGILLGILMPSMMNYYRRSRIQAANADAKMVYNAAQTAAQRFIAQDRMAATPTGFDGVLYISYTPANGAILADPQPTIFDPDAVQELSESVNRTVSGAEEICWAVCVDNYLVKGAVAAENANTNNYGTYSHRVPTGDDEMPSIATLDSVRKYPHTFADAIGILQTLAGYYDRP